jgi:hypothetical protein
MAKFTIDNVVNAIKELDINLIAEVGMDEIVDEATYMFKHNYYKHMELYPAADLTIAYIRYYNKKLKTN